MKTESDNDLADIIQSAHRSKATGRWISLLLLIAIGVGAYYWHRSNSEKQPTGPKFTTQKVSRGDIALTITTTGTLEPTNQVTIGSEVSGTVEEVYVDINDRVTKGQALAKLDPTKLTQQAEQNRAALRASEAKVAQAEASLKEAEANLKRLQQLHKVSNGRTPSQADLDSALATLDRGKADLLSAQADVSQNQAALVSAESDLSKTILTSPVDGVVLTRSVEPGQTVAAQFTAPELFIIAEDLSSMVLTVAVAEADIGRVEDGQEANFTVDAWPKRTFSAEVQTVSYGSEITDNVVTYETELAVSNTDHSLRPGMTATATIAVAQSKDVLLVPNTALRFDPKTAMASQAPAKEQKKSLLDSLTPRPPRGGNSGGRKRPEGESPNSEEGKPQIVWTLTDGHPAPIRVETGITNGRFTEVSGPDLHVDTEVITAAQTSTE
ncbi:efflux RND transporter periplasmic adaptor subunit [Roseibacillus persicicus]|uniref:Hemolysin D n=1 Tax=Roseibacillus persicicus TaxID=454148 RepID=A0A918TR76_9BACT|nr:efflux RND transporter periplasmic adaptor subunit [Roseibacillus persicicus]GHC53197.1 hemolysin D [Roseibacillus persicicus]